MKRIIRHIPVVLPGSSFLVSGGLKGAEPYGTALKLEEYFYLSVPLLLPYQIWYGPYRIVSQLDKPCFQDAFDTYRTGFGALRIRFGTILIRKFRPNHLQNCCF